VIGPGKLPSVGKALGDSIREFRKATSDDVAPAPTSPPSSSPSDAAPGAATRPGDDTTS
jgi:Sec-independent protein translocase protein TatA